VATAPSGIIEIASDPNFDPTPKVFQRIDLGAKD
jgi:hypothetical protein